MSLLDQKNIRLWLYDTLDIFVSNIIVYSVNYIVILDKLSKSSNQININKLDIVLFYA
jgi:hypothetical protein